MPDGADARPARKAHGLHGGGVHIPGPADAPETILWENEAVPAPDFNDVLHPEAADCAVLGRIRATTTAENPA
ncbi:MAG: hypothetical protein ACLUVB_03975 [Acutalibacteraceae bacterium]